jgi:hypothetical protein
MISLPPNPKYQWVFAFDSVQISDAIELIKQMINKIANKIKILKKNKLVNLGTAIIRLKFCYT